jgi:hypothetical protein
MLQQLVFQTTNLLNYQRKHGIRYINNRLQALEVNKSRYKPTTVTFVEYKLEGEKWPKLTKLVKLSELLMDNEIEAWHPRVRVFNFVKSLIITTARAQSQNSF